MFRYIHNPKIDDGGWRGTRLRCSECDTDNAPLLHVSVACIEHNEDECLCLSCFLDIEGIADFLEPL